MNLSTRRSRIAPVWALTLLVALVASMVAPAKVDAASQYIYPYHNTCSTVGYAYTWQTGAGLDHVNMYHDDDMGCAAQVAARAKGHNGSAWEVHGWIYGADEANAYTPGYYNQMQGEAQMLVGTWGPVVATSYLYN